MVEKVKNVTRVTYKNVAKIINIEVILKANLELIFAIDSEKNSNERYVNFSGALLNKINGKILINNNAIGANNVPPINRGILNATFAKKSFLLFKRTCKK